MPGPIVRGRSGFELAKTILSPLCAKSSTKHEKTSQVFTVRIERLGTFDHRVEPCLILWRAASAPITQVLQISVSQLFVQRERHTRRLHFTSLSAPVSGTGKALPKHNPSGLKARQGGIRTIPPTADRDRHDNVARTRSCRFFGNGLGGRLPAHNAVRFSRHHTVQRRRPDALPELPPVSKPCHDVGMRALENKLPESSPTPAPPEPVPSSRPFRF